MYIVAYFKQQMTSNSHQTNETSSKNKRCILQLHQVVGTDVGRTERSSRQKSVAEVPYNTCTLHKEGPPSAGSSQSNKQK